MSEPTTTPDVEVRMRIVTATEIIAEFMRTGLPIVRWNIEADGEDNDRFPTIEGRATNSDIVAAYAEHFDTLAIDQFNDGRFLCARGEARGLHVAVWAATK